MTAPATPVLAVRGLRKRYGATEAVAGIDFTVAERSIVGLLGPNGAGKTTTISMLLGVLEPTAESIEIDGLPLGRARRAALAAPTSPPSTRRCPATSPCARTCACSGCSMTSPTWRAASPI